MKPAILLLALTSIALAQGPLDPPGAPGLTMRSLEEIEPRIPLNQNTTPGDATCVFKITRAGSYMLAGNLTPPAGKHGILIALPAPGTVEVDLKGFTMDGSNAGLTASGVLYAANDMLDWAFKLRVHNGTISNFAGNSCLQAASTASTFVFETITMLLNGAGVSTTGHLLMSDCSITGGTGIPIQMGADSVLERVTIRTSHAGIPKIIEGGAGCLFKDVMISSVMGGSTHTSAITLGPDSTINGMRLRLSDAIFSGPVLANTSGFTEVSGLSIELNSVTAPCVSNSFSWGLGASLGLIGTTYGGDGNIVHGCEEMHPNNIKATNSTFNAAIVILPAGLTTSLNNVAAFQLTGTTTAPTVVRVEADNVSLNYQTFVAATATVSGAVVDVAASGTTIHANIRGGNVGVRLSSGSGHTVEGCSLIGLLVPGVGIQISAGVTNSLVRNNTAARLAGAGMLVVNNGGPTNFIAPILTTPAQLNANTNPFANIVH